MTVILGIIISWFKSLRREVWYVLAIVIAISMFFLIRSLFTEDLARLETRQTEAAINSGKDAVNTLVEAQRRDEETNRKVEETQDEVDKAPDGAAADRAGRDGLCQHFGICTDK